MSGAKKQEQIDRQQRLDPGGQGRASVTTVTSAAASRPSRMMPFSLHNAAVAEEEKEHHAVAGGELRPATGAHVQPHAEAHRQRRRQLGLADDVADRLDVDRVHGEERRGDPGAGDRQELEGEPEDHQRERRIKSDVDRVEDPRRPVSDDPLHREGGEGQRPVEGAAVLAWPVPLDKVERQLAQRVDLRVVPDDQDVVESETVPETRGAGGERKQDE